MIAYNAPRTLSRAGAPSALERVRQAASKDRKKRFTALLHHIYDPETLRQAYLGLKRDASPGMDGETWRHYGEALEENLQDLAGRLKCGAYRAKPVRRVYIPKADGRSLNLLGIATPGDRLPALAGNRGLYRDGEPIAVREGRETRFLVDLAPAERWQAESALVKRSVAPRLKAYLGRSA